MKTEKIELHNVAELIGPNKIMSRYPDSVRAKILQGARDRSLDAAGVELRCNVGAGGGNIVISIEGKQPITAELYQGDFLAWTMLIGPGRWEIPLEQVITKPWFFGLNEKGDGTEVLRSVKYRRFDPALRRILFPYTSQIGLLEVQGDLTPPLPDQVPALRLLSYGSSITHGHTALTADSSWAPRTAALLGMDFFNLGVAGSAQCEEPIGQWIADNQEWDIATLELGINMTGMSTDEFREKVRAFLKAVVSGLGKRRIVCLDLFRHFTDFPGGNATKANEFRKTVAEAVQELKTPQVTYLSVRELPDPLGLTSDLLHPNPLGMEQMARFIAQKMRVVVKSYIKTESESVG